MELSYIIGKKKVRYNSLKNAYERLKEAIVYSENVRR